MNVTKALGPEVLAVSAREESNEPIVIRPASPSVAPMDWIADQKEGIEKELRLRRTLFFRGFGSESPDRLLAIDKIRQAYTFRKIESENFNFSLRGTP